MRGSVVVLEYTRYDKGGGKPIRYATIDPRLGVGSGGGACGPSGRRDVGRYAVRNKDARRYLGVVALLCVCVNRPRARRDVNYLCICVFICVFVF